jgi:hypothetical protein
MTKFKFVGFGEKESYFGQGEFTIGEIYETQSIKHYKDSNLESDALFTDDNGMEMWEELHGFEEVTDHDTE